MENIIKGIHEGYIWKSDSDKPIVITSETEINLDPNINPFIVEGLLRAKNISYAIKYVDGKYIVTSSKVEEEKVFDNAVNYYANPRLQEKGIRKLKFYREWKPVEDEFCNNMEVLQPGKLVFIGFERKEETK